MSNAAAALVRGVPVEHLEDMRNEIGSNVTNPTVALHMRAQEHLLDRLEPWAVRRDEDYEDPHRPANRAKHAFAMHPRIIHRDESLPADEHGGQEEHDAPHLKKPPCYRRRLNDGQGDGRTTLACRELDF